MKLAGSTMTRMVDPLVQKDLADRKPDPERRPTGCTRLSDRKRAAGQTPVGRRAVDLLFDGDAGYPGECGQVLHSLELLNGAIMNALQCCFRMDAQIRHFLR